MLRDKAKIDFKSLQLQKLPVNSKIMSKKLG
jgi:hypothetical protein